jgi:hypothetical protein
MRTTNAGAGFVRSWRPRIAWMTTVAAILMTTGIGSAQTIGVACALPYVSGEATASCVGTNKITITTTGTDSNAKVTAELLGLQQNGNLIKSFIVQNGSVAQIGSRISPWLWNFQQPPDVQCPTCSQAEVFAPVPLLHVTVQDQGQTADAYCSVIPYVEVVQPAGGVVTSSSGNNTNVVVAAPLTNPADAHLYVDGVDLFSLVPNYQTCTAASPCNGVVTINGNAVNYANLVVDIAPNISTPASNTIRVTLNSLACGGHIFHVTTAQEPGYPAEVTGQCNVDSLSKSATSSVFAITITNPTAGQVQPLVPTPVAGQVCSGTQISDVNINGLNLSVAGETYNAGNGTTTGPVYQVPINTTIPQTNLYNDVWTANPSSLGTFDAGSNRLAASATDINGNRTFENVIFATGAVSPIGVDPNATIFQSAAIESAVHGEVEKLVREKIKKAMDAPTSTAVENAFVLGLSASGAQTMFNQLCTSPVPGVGQTPGQIFQQQVTNAILALQPLPTLNPSVPCSCSPTVSLNFASINVGTDVTCGVTFNDGYFDVLMTLPNVSVSVDAFGSCEDTFLGACTEFTSIGQQASASITGITFSFRVTTDDILGNTVCGTGSPPPCIPPVFYSGNTAASTSPVVNPNTGDSGLTTGCILSDLCSFAVDVFTFGAVDLSQIDLNLSVVQNFSGQIGASQPDPIKLHQIQVDPTVVTNYNQKVSGALSSVSITPAGITAGLVGNFATLALDTSVPSTPGVPMTPTPVPVLPVPGAKDIFVGLSDQAINMMFASLTAAGKLETGTACPLNEPNCTSNPPPGCVDTGATVGSLLPTSCDSLNLGNDIATVAARGYCHAIRGDNCGTISFNDPMASATDNANFTASEQGECYGAQGLPAGQSCATVANGNLLEWGVCSITPDYNLHADQPLLFCAQADVPPVMLIQPNNPGTGTAVNSVLHIPSLSVALLIQRDVGEPVPGPFASNVPGCFTEGSNAVDCNVFEACLDLNLDFSMGFQTCSQDNNPGFSAGFQQIQLVNRSVGTVCGGSTTPTSDSNILATSSNNQITIPLGQNGAQFAPPICGVGLNLGGFVQCTNPGIVAMGNTYPQSADYLAITCQIQP